MAIFPRHVTKILMSSCRFQIRYWFLHFKSIILVYRDGNKLCIIIRWLDPARWTVYLIDSWASIILSFPLRWLKMVLVMSKWGHPSPEQGLDMSFLKETVLKTSLPPGIHCFYKFSLEHTSNKWGHSCSAIDYCIVCCEINLAVASVRSRNKPISI